MNAKNRPRKGGPRNGAASNVRKSLPRPPYDLICDALDEAWETSQAIKIAPPHRLIVIPDVVHMSLELNYGAVPPAGPGGGTCVREDGRWARVYRTPE